MELKYKNIAISGLPGAGSTTLGKLLAEKLGWEYFSGGEFMRAYAIEKGLFKDNTHLHHDAMVYGDDFDRLVDYGMRQKNIEESGRIYDSWLSGFMTQGITSTLHVLVICSDDAVRVDRIVNRDEVNVDEAKKHIFEREQRNRDKWARMYAEEWKKWVVGSDKMSAEDKIDFWNPNLYDLTIDTFKHNREETLQKVLQEVGYTD